MTTEEAIRQICSLPVDFRTGNKSVYDLLRDSRVERRSVSVASVLPILRLNPGLVDEWLMWSEDERSTPAYYFSEEGGKYMVGRLPDESDSVEFDSRLDACADYIVKTIRMMIDQAKSASS